MSQYTCAQVANLWRAAGGAGSATIFAVAVASAESGRNPDAVSTSDDHGLWQINGIHFPAFGVNARTVLVPATNARIAVALSNAGLNWAAWCTCWTDPGRDCGHGNLAAPQPGSPADDEIGFVVSQLGTGAGQVGTGVASGASPGQAGWSTYTHFLTTWSRSEWGAMHDARQSVRGLFR